MSYEKPANPVTRIVSLLRRGPHAITLRLYDQSRRVVTGCPVWQFSRITPQLYIGGQHSMRGWQRMQAEGITAIVNMRETKHDDVAKGISGIKHLHLATRDNTPPTLENLQSAADFIAQEIEAGGKVYVHCAVGVGRAPTAAAAYFISTGMSAHEALATLAAVRPFIHLTGRQMQQLEKFAAQQGQ